MRRRARACTVTGTTSTRRGARQWTSQTRRRRRSTIPWVSATCWRRSPSPALFCQARRSCPSPGVPPSRTERARAAQPRPRGKGCCQRVGRRLPSPASRCQGRGALDSTPRTRPLTTVFPSLPRTWSTSRGCCRRRRTRPPRSRRPSTSRFAPLFSTLRKWTQWRGTDTRPPPGSLIPISIYWRPSSTCTAKWCWRSPRGSDPRWRCPAPLSCPRWPTYCPAAWWWALRSLCRPGSITREWERRLVCEEEASGYWLARLNLLIVTVLSRVCWWLLDFGEL